ncbi:MAG TPA: sigma-70 family RNA polymerase sigma factor [Flavisolibacter sp.]|nr:sigma-70 family RNA polymerase sigma factor [Flavisolibacter sp.]
MAFIRSISSQRSDQELIADYKQSLDLNVAADLYQRYMDLVYGVCLKYLKHPENAQDSTLAIYEEICTKLLKHEVDNFKAWIYTLAKNHCLMRLRSEKKKGTVSFDVDLMQSEENLHLEEVLEKEEQFKQLELCMGQLAAEQRQVIQLFYLEHKCYNEITELTGIEWNKVRSYIQNGRRNLKLCMEKHKTQTVV